MNAEHNILAKAQGAILLTYQSSSVNLHAGSQWLTAAIQNAMLIGAHVYHKSDPADPQRGLKKRLWWSIILRDRILPLGLRRHLQVTAPNFDLSFDPLDEHDLQDEIYGSEVYSPATKGLLASVLKVQCHLAMVLTGVVTTVYSPTGFTQPKVMSNEELADTMVNIESFRTNLAQWASDAKAIIGSFCDANKVHKSVILYSELTFMYYKYVPFSLFISCEETNLTCFSAARVALCHFQTLMLEVNHELVLDSYEERLEDIKNDLESAALGITRSVKRLLAHGVARHLPISA